MNDTNKYQPFNAATVALSSSNLIEASAGTGKTYSIAVLTLRLVLEQRMPIQQILMVTFTKAAVAELETRIRQFMRNALKVSQGIPVSDEIITAIVQASINDVDRGQAVTQQLLQEAILFLDETAILTIHSFCQRVLTEFAFETRQVFGATILTDLPAILTDQVNVFWRRHVTTMHPALLKALSGAGLTRQRLVAVMQMGLSGKKLFPSTPLTDGFLSPEHQVQLADSLMALEEQAQAIIQQAVDYIAGNIGAIRTATLNNKFAAKNMGHLLDNYPALLEAIKGNKEKAYVLKLYREVIEIIEELTPVINDQSRQVKLLISQVYQLGLQVVAAATTLHKEQHNQLGFDDMINKLYEAVVVDNNEFLIGSLKKKYTAAFIDEFQDTDKMQYEIFNRLFARECILFYIGDAKQSIYAWRKADIFTYFKAKQTVANIYNMHLNYRSSAPYIEAMNAFFMPTKDFDAFCFSGESGEVKYTLVQAPPGTTKGVLYVEKKPAVPITIFENPTNESISQTVTAQIINLLSGGRYTLLEKGVHRPVRPSDIGILVRKNSQAATIKHLLSRYGIPAVTIDDSKLLQSAEAQHLLYVLAAVINVNASGINRALLSPLTGYKAADILALEDELALNRFKNYQYLWEQEGVYVMLNRFLADYRVKQVLLSAATPNGERIVTNVLQLMELLHKIQTQKQFSPLELANWLQRGVEGMEVEGDEFEQRVESDEEAVKIVTIHKSKGLEYNIVFAPFLDLQAATKFDFLTFRDAESGDYLFADTGLLNDEQVRITEQQLEQENRRLVYVAVTRAVYKCYLNKNTYGRYSQSALAPFIQMAKEFKSPLIAFQVSPDLPARFRLFDKAANLRPVYALAPGFQLTAINWRKLSYTYLDAGHLPANISNSNLPLQGYAAFIFKQLKRGANTGNLIHYILERIDFADSVFWDKTIGDALRRFIPGAGEEYAAGLTELLHHITTARLSIAGSHFSLAELKRANRLNELEFDFNVKPFHPATINRLSTPDLPFQVRQAKELEGIMNGKIDLFFEHAGKYYILDWKSNFLGDLTSDYSPGRIREAMAASNYHLQHLVYTLAVKKYLRLRLPGFDYATHFGGVIYLFVRGVRDHQDTGLFTYRPPEALIDTLDELLGETVAG